jgi:hypothetical protein
MTASCARAAFLLILLLQAQQPAVADVFCGATCKSGQGFYTPPGCAACDCCAPCPPGAWCRNTDANGTTTPCAPGSANPLNGSRNANACVACGVGQAAPQEGSTACRACAPGRFASYEGAPECALCPQDHVAPSAGASSCTLCPAVRAQRPCARARAPRGPRPAQRRLLTQAHTHTHTHNTHTLTRTGRDSTAQRAPPRARWWWALPLGAASWALQLS